MTPAAGDRLPGRLRGRRRTTTCRRSSHPDIHDPGLDPFRRAGRRSPSWPRRTARRSASRSSRPATGRCSRSSTSSSTGCARACSKPTASPTGGRIACSPARGRSRRRWPCSGTATSPPTRTRCATIRKLLRQIETLPPPRHRQLPRPHGRDRAGPGDALLPRCRRQRQGRAERELRPRNHGAVHHGRGPLHRERHPRGAPARSPAGTTSI